MRSWIGRAIFQHPIAIQDISESAALSSFSESPTSALVDSRAAGRVHNVRDVPVVITSPCSQQYPTSSEGLKIGSSSLCPRSRGADHRLLGGVSRSLPRQGNRSWSILRAGFLGPSTPGSLRRCPAAVLAPHSRSRRSHISALLSCMRVSRRRVAINSTSLAGSWLLRAYAFVDAPGLRVGSR
jgi:hypothetical protein